MSETPWTDSRETAVTVYDQAGQPYEMLPFVLASDCRIFEERLREEREWLQFVVNFVRLPLGIAPDVDNFDREKILAALDAALSSNARLIDTQQLAIDGANAEIARLWRENEKLKKQLAKQPAADVPAQQTVEMPL